MDIANFSNKRVLICYIEKSYNEFINQTSYRKTLLDCVSKYWDIPNLSKANEADFVIGVGADKTILVIAKPNEKGWQKVSTFASLKKESPVIKNPKLLERYAFEGIDISKSAEVKDFYGKKLSERIKFDKDITWPLYYVNNEVVEW
jgi:hypothetical protein